MIESRNAVRWSRLNVPGDAFGVTCDENGPSIGPIQLLKRTDRGFEPRFARELDFIFGAALGRPTNFASKVPGLSAAADALEKGDLARAMLITQFMWLPSLPDGRALERAVRADTLAKLGFNPDQPRDEHGRWTAEDVPEGQSVDDGRLRPGFTPAQSIFSLRRLFLGWIRSFQPKPCPKLLHFREKFCRRLSERPTLRCLGRWTTRIPTTPIVLRNGKKQRITAVI